MFLILAVGFGVAGIVVNSVAGSPSKLSKTAVLEYGGSAIVCWIIAAVLLACAVSRFNRTRRAAEIERADAIKSTEAAAHLERARRLAEQLLTGQEPPVTPVWDVVMGAGEQVLLDGLVGYSRYYGLGGPAASTDASIHHYGGARPTAAPVDHAATQAGKRSGPHASAFDAATRWRERQQCRVVLTDRRVLCQIQPKGWVTFEHARVSAIQPVAATGSVVLEYPDMAPLCLSGPIVTEIMVGVVWALYGATGLREHPALTEVSESLPSPHAAVSAPSSSSPSSAHGETLSVLPSPAEAPVAGETHSVEYDTDVGLLTWLADRQLVRVEDAAEQLRVDARKAVDLLDGLANDGLVLRVRLSDGSSVVYRATHRGVARLDRSPPMLRAVDLAAVADLVRGAL